MKKLIVILVGLILLSSSDALGYELPFSKTISLENFDDSYNQAFTLPVYIQRGSTLETEDRMIRIAISPQERMVWEDQDGTYEDGDYFFKVLVSIVLSDRKGTVSKSFKSYLNCELMNCDPKAWRGRLFWDHAGEDQADLAGKTFDQTTPMIISDQYFEVTLHLIDFRKSADWYCDTKVDPEEYYYFFYCISDADCFVFIDTLTLRLTIDYSLAQKSMQTSHGDASQHVELANGFFQAGEFAKAKAEYEQAMFIYNQIGADSSDIQEQIKLCDSYLTAQEALEQGTRLFQEAAGIEDYQQAIEKYKDARSSFERAKAKFDELGATNSAECQSWIDKCNEQISSLEGVGRLRNRLIYVIIGIVAVAFAGIVIKKIGGRGTPRMPLERDITINVQYQKTGKIVKIRVSESDKIGRIRQLAGTELGVVPSKLIYEGKLCLPDQTVRECGIADGAIVKVEAKEKEEKKETKKIKEVKKAIFCPECGAINPLGSTFCGECGAKFSNSD